MVLTYSEVTSEVTGKIGPAASVRYDPKLWMRQAAIRTPSVRACASLVKTAGALLLAAHPPPARSDPSARLRGFQSFRSRGSAGP